MEVIQATSHIVSISYYVIKISLKWDMRSLDIMNKLLRNSNKYFSFEQFIRNYKMGR